MVKIAIICCDNVKNEFSCGAAGCLGSFNARKAMFERYKDDKDVELVGFATCAGCPTIVAPDKILKKVKPLVEIGKAEKIHFSSCMVTLCPFMQKYRSAIKAAYPDVEVLMGTDSTPDQPHETMKTIFKKLLTEPEPDISAEFTRVLQSAEYKKHQEG